jgi:hypothetical protein
MKLVNLIIALVLYILCIIVPFGLWIIADRYFPESNSVLIAKFMGILSFGLIIRVALTDYTDN